MDINDWNVGNVGNVGKTKYSLFQKSMNLAG